MKTKARQGYSLTEISVAIAIIVVLFALLFGLWGTISRRTKTVTCVSNLRQIMVAINNYAGAHNGRLPFISPDPFWADRITPYLSTAEVFRCPEGIGDPEFYAGFDTGLFYDGKKPVAFGTVSAVFTNSGTVGFFEKRDPSDPYWFQALKGQGTFSGPVYLIFANPIASPKMQEKYSIWKTFFEWGGCIDACYGGSCNGKTRNDAKDSQYKVTIVSTKPWNNTIAVPDLRHWAVRSGGSIVLGPFQHPDGVKGSDFEFKFQALDPLVGIPVGRGGTQITDSDTLSVTPNFTNAGLPFHITPVPPGVDMNRPLTNAGNGLWIWNEFINPSHIQVRTMFHTENATLSPYFSYRYDVLVNDTPSLPPWYTPGSVPVTGTISDVGSMQGVTAGNSYGANNLAGNVRKGMPFTLGEIAADTILLADYGTLTINWEATAVTGIGNQVTITSNPKPALFKRHIGGKVSILKADGSVETIDPERIPLGWWTPKPAD